MKTFIVDSEQQEKEIEKLLQELANDDLQELYAVGKDKAGRFIVYCTGRIHGLGTAASVLQAEFAKEWHDN